MKYFAYGEKMCSAQLQEVVANARYLGVVKVMGYKLFFHNRGTNDLSGKCNIVPVQDASNEIFGILYEIPQSDRYLLDKDQSLGYQNQEITLKVFPLANSDHISPLGVFAFTYIAHKDNIFEDLVPYNWYKDLVISGAKEHHLPPEYIHHLEQFSSTKDPNVHRAIKQERYLASLLL